MATTSMQMEPTPLAETTAPAFEQPQAGSAENRAGDVDPVTQAADTAGVDPLTDTPTTHTADPVSDHPTTSTTGGALTSEPESLPPSTGTSTAPAPTTSEGGSTVLRQGSSDSQTAGGKRAKVPGLGDTHVLENHENAPTFKEKVQGFAKVFRGSTLGKEGVKEEGKRILAGEKKASVS